MSRRRRNSALPSDSGGTIPKVAGRRRGVGVTEVRVNLGATEGVGSTAETIKDLDGLVQRRSEQPPADGHQGVTARDDGARGAATKIRLMRLGKIRAPYYRIVVADSRTKRDGRVIETIGKYHPREDPSFIEVDTDRAQYWLGVGAQPTEPVAAILRKTGAWQKFKGEPAPPPLLVIAPKEDQPVATGRDGARIDVPKDKVARLLEIRKRSDQRLEEAEEREKR